MFCARRALSSSALISTPKRGIKLIPKQHLQQEESEGPFLFARKASLNNV